MSEELVYYVDEIDNVIGKVTRRDMRAKNLMHRSVSIFVFNSKGELLVHRRTATKDVNPSYFALCFGGVLEYGESYDKGARRELAEETGLKSADLVFLCDYCYDGPDNKAVGKLYKTISDGPFSFQKEEVESARFLRLDELRQFMEKENVCKDDIVCFLKYLDILKNDKDRAENGIDGKKEKSDNQKK